jgi:hypothetical protein
MTERLAESLAGFVTGLAPHDSSLGVALLELVRHADADGAVERGKWLAAVRSAYPRAVATWETTSLATGAAARPTFSSSRGAGGDRPGTS